MARSIWKFTVPVDGQSHGFDIPDVAQILHVAVQDQDIWDEVQFWCEVGLDRDAEERRFIVVGTGHVTPEGGVFIGTAVCAKGNLVWHLYEVPR